MKQNIKKINRSIKLYPLFSAFSADLILFVSIDTLFLTLVKGLNASQIAIMTTVSLLFSIIMRTPVLSIAKKIGNTNSIRLGTLLFLIATIILTFGKTFTAMIIYKCTYEIAYMFLNMLNILLKNNLISISKENQYYNIRNKSKIIYSVITMLAALISGYLFNLNGYLPMYISILIYSIVVITSFLLYEENNLTKKEIKKKNRLKQKNISIIFWIILSNVVFRSIIMTGQGNSKLFMQYDFQKYLSIESVTYYITVIVFISRIARLVGNMFFGKIYEKIKDKFSIVLSVFLSLAFFLLLIGHFLPIPFICKVIIMALGFFLILATRDSFQVYIEDTALNIVDKEEQQKIMLDLEIYRKIGTLIISTAITLILLKYELVIIMFLLLILSVIEIFISKKLCKKLENVKKEF